MVGAVLLMGLAIENPDRTYKALQWARATKLAYSSRWRIQLKDPRVNRHLSQELFEDNVSKRLARRIVLVVVPLLAVFGVLSPYEYNVLPVSLIIEVTFFVCALLLTPRRQLTSVVVASSAAIYLIISTFTMLIWNVSPWLDFLQAYKAFIYLFVLSLICGRRLLRVVDVAFLAKFLIVCSLIKYSYSRVFEFEPHLASRPGLLTENNYEITLYAILLFVGAPAMGKRKTFWFAALSVVVIISGSISGTAVLVILYVALYVRARSPIAFFSVLGIGLFLAVLVSTIANRVDVVATGKLDRQVFFGVFLGEISDWNVTNWLFGTLPITPLSPEGCARLSFYESLFSSDGSGNCYSVILHSYLLRLLFDHGIMGSLILLVGFVTLALRVTRSKRSALCLFALGIANSASVSGFNSEFVMLGMLIALCSTHVRDDNSTLAPLKFQTQPSRGRNHH